MPELREREAHLVEEIRRHKGMQTSRNLHQFFLPSTIC
jgi:hypothetical protein